MFPVYAFMNKKCYPCGRILQILPLHDLEMPRPLLWQILVFKAISFMPLMFSVTQFRSPNLFFFSLSIPFPPKFIHVFGVCVCPAKLPRPFISEAWTSVIIACTTRNDKEKNPSASPLRPPPQMVWKNGRGGGGVVWRMFSCIGLTADFGRWFSVAQWSDASLQAWAVKLFCLSDNSDVEVIGSLLLVHRVLLSRAVCLFLSADEIIS
jgi:hypothetical protein